MHIKNQTVTSVVEINDDHHDVSSKAIRAVREAVNCFSLDQGRAELPSDASPWELLCDTVRKIADAFELDSEVDLKGSETLHRFLQATFDTDTQAFLMENSEIVFDHLSPIQKERILAQAIAAMTMIFERLLNTNHTITAGVVNREAQFFAESEQRTWMLNDLEKTHLFEHCYMHVQIADLIMGAMRAEDPSISTKSLAIDDNLDVMISSASICERPENMGSPFGFTIMAIN